MTGCLDSTLYKLVMVTKSVLGGSVIFLCIGSGMPQSTIMHLVAFLLFKLLPMAVSVCVDRTEAAVKRGIES